MSLRVAVYKRFNENKKGFAFIVCGYFFIPFNVCTFALQGERLIPERGHVPRSKPPSEILSWVVVGFYTSSI